MDYRLAEELRLLQVCYQDVHASFARDAFMNKVETDLQLFPPLHTSGSTSRPLATRRGVGRGSRCGALREHCMHRTAASGRPCSKYFTLVSLRKFF